MSSYYEYANKLARLARKADDLEFAARQQAVARRAAKRVELQPQFEAVSAWQTEQLKLRGLCSEVLAETQTKLDALMAIVNAA